MIPISGRGITPQVQLAPQRLFLCQQYWINRNLHTSPSAMSSASRLYYCRKTVQDTLYNCSAKHTTVLNSKEGGGLKLE